MRETVERSQMIAGKRFIELAALGNAYRAVLDDSLADETHFVLRRRLLNAA